MSPCPAVGKRTLPWAGACGRAQSPVQQTARTTEGRKSLCLAYVATCFISAKEVVFTVKLLFTWGKTQLKFLSEPLQSYIT